MAVQTQKICIWAAVFFLTCFGIGFMIMAQFIPPLAPTASMEDVMAFYMENSMMVRLGLLVILAGTGFLVPFAAVITVQMKRIEGEHAPLAYTQLVCNAMAAILFIIPLMIWLTILYRPERDPADFLLFSDFAWLCFLAPFTLVLVQLLVTGLAILMDKQAQPVYPRWLGYFNIWCGLLFIPGGLAVIFHTGPFAWNGLLVFWLALVVFTIWYVVMLVMTMKAVNQQAKA